MANFFKLKLSGLALAGLFSFAVADSSQMVKDIVNLRAEIDQLNSQIDDLRNRIKMENRNFQTRKAELMASLDRENLRLRELQQEIEKKKQQLAQKGSKNTEITPAVIDGIDLLSAYVENSLPFKKQDRLNQLSTLKKNLQEGSILPDKAANQLWAMYEDEIRLARENGIHKDTVMINGKPYIVDVAKVGMMGMFFKTGDGRYGVVKKSGQGYTVTMLERSEDKENIDKLFDSFKKQIRTGYFILPSFVGEVRK